MYKHVEEELSASLDERAVLRQALEERLLQPGQRDFPCSLLHTYPLPQVEAPACLPRLPACPALPCLPA